MRRLTLHAASLSKPLIAFTFAALMTACGTATDPSPALEDDADVSPKEAADMGRGETEDDASMSRDQARPDAAHDGGTLHDLSGHDIASRPPPERTLEPAAGQNPLGAGAEVEKIEYDREGDKLDNPVWYERAQGMVWRDAEVMIERDGVIAPLYTLADGSLSHEPKTVDHQGHLIGLRYVETSSQGRIEQIVRFDGQGGVLDLLAEEYKGHKLPHFNDMAVGRDGSIYLTQRRGKANDDYLGNSGGPGALFRLTPRGELLEEVSAATLEALRNPNGIALSPDGQTVYVGASDYDVKDHQGLWAFDVAEDGALGEGRFLAKMSRPDGIAVDAAGNIYVSNGQGKTLAVFAPDGSRWGGIELPTGSHTNCEFGGPEGKTLYITTKSALFTAELLYPGEIPWRQW